MPCSVLLQRGKGLALPKLVTLDFIDYRKKALSPLRSGWEARRGEMEVREKGREEGLGLVCKKKNTKKRVLCLKMVCVPDVIKSHGLKSADCREC